MLPVFDAGQHVALGGPITRELVRDEHPWHVRQALEQLPQELHRRALIAPGLHQDVKHVAVLIDGAPQGVGHAVDAHEDLVQMPRVAGARATAAQRIGIGLPELPAPLAHRLVGHDDAPLGEQLLHIAVTEREAEIQPDGVTDDLGREAVTGVVGRRDFISHVGSIARRRRSIAS